MDRWNRWEGTSARVTESGHTGARTAYSRAHAGGKTSRMPSAAAVPPVSRRRPTPPRPVGGDETRAANRSWWDGEADDYYAEHGAFLGDGDFVWGPEGWTEAELDLLEVRDGMTVLEIGSGAAQCSRWLARHHDVRVVASDLSMGMLRTARRIERVRRCRWGGCRRHCGMPAGATASGPLPHPLPLLQCDGLALPFGDAHASTGCSRRTACVPFVADSGAVHGGGGAGAAAGRAVRVLDVAPAALGLPRRPRAARAHGDGVLLRPHALRRERGRDA